ncbi:Neurotransmitter-gated ion-channel ligand binding domain protein [Ancylostoma duodenale]|uniref:Neurotransmitter-gated ion-channel ligand binding domain protein n=1 Tax=Ancylostoma duodenale TaxID=51022 RepID=A0A0C2GWB1_9BILA|nr:Neurotransmitter-gated ion-channel ligand binding domain protein [Ancylostoma duodenale]
MLSKSNRFDIVTMLIDYNLSDLLQSAPRQLMTVIFEYAMTWVDERLSWDPKEYDDIDHIYVLRSNVWIPEITPFDSLEVVETRPDYKQHVPITYQGVASFYTSIVTSVVCPIDVTFFPFDQQNCSMKLLSYSFFSDEIGMQNEINKNLQISGVGNDEWEVTDILARSEIRYNASESDQINEFTFFMKRNPSYYVALIIIPSFVLTFLCVAGLFTSPLIVDDLGKMSSTTCRSQAQRYLDGDTQCALAGGLRRICPEKPCRYGSIWLVNVSSMCGPEIKAYDVYGIITIDTYRYEMSLVLVELVVHIRERAISPG